MGIFQNLSANRVEGVEWGVGRFIRSITSTNGKAFCLLLILKYFTLKAEQLICEKRRPTFLSFVFHRDC